MTKFVIDQTKREALDADAARKHLERLDESVTFVKLSGKSFGDDSAQVAADALQRASSTLTHLDISDIIASRPEDEAKRALNTIASALSSCKHLTYINLSDNALGAKGIQAVGQLLSGQENLEHLFFCNNGLAADAGNLITSALTETTPTSLLTLHFHNNLLETAGAVALGPVIESSPKLNDFRFSSLRLARDGSVHVCKAIKPCMSTTLRRLNLSDNAFGHEGATALAEALRDAPFLTTLLVSDVLLGDEGVQLVCDALVEGAPKLEVLDISANEMGLEGARGLARLMAVGRLTEVQAEDNELGNAGAARLAKSIVKSATLQKVDVSGSEIHSRGALALAKAAAKLLSLKILIMDRNNLSEEAIPQVREILGDKLGSLDENDEEDDVDDDEEYDGEDDGEEYTDEGHTDRAIKGDTASNVDINPEQEGVDDLVDQVEKLAI